MRFQNSIQLAAWLANRYPTIFAALQKRAALRTASASGGLGQLCVCGIGCFTDSCGGWECALGDCSDWGCALTGSGEGVCAGSSAISSCLSRLFCGTDETACLGINSCLDTDLEACAAQSESCVSRALCGSGGGAASVATSAVQSVASLLSSAGGLATLAELAKNYVSAGTGSSTVSSALKSPTTSKTVTTTATCASTAIGSCCGGAETGVGVSSGAMVLLLLAGAGLLIYSLSKR